MELTSDNVNRIGQDSVFRDEEVVGQSSEEIRKRPDATIVDGIVAAFGFHTGRLRGHMGDIRSMLRQLPSDFFEEEGGGWAFINARYNNKREEWGDLADAEVLIALGRGVGLVILKGFYGDMPYYSVDLNVS